jgi:hypothetical protein
MRESAGWGLRARSGPAVCPIHRILCDGWESTRFAVILCAVELALLFLAVPAIEQIANRFSPRFVGFRFRLALFGALGSIGRAGLFRFAARRTAVGEAGLVRLEFKFFLTDNEKFFGK